MKIVNPEWIKAARVSRAAKEMKIDELITEAGLASREYASAVMNGRTKSVLYADAISRVLEVTVPYLIEIPASAVCGAS